MCCGRLRHVRRRRGYPRAVGGIALPVPVGTQELHVRTRFHLYIIAPTIKDDVPTSTRVPGTGTVQVHAELLDERSYDALAR